MVAAPARKKQQCSRQREKAAAARRTRCQTRACPCGVYPLRAMQTRLGLVDERTPLYARGGGESHGDASYACRSTTAAATARRPNCAGRRLHANIPQAPLAPPLSWAAAELPPSHSARACGLGGWSGGLRRGLRGPNTLAGHATAPLALQQSGHATQVRAQAPAPLFDAQVRACRVRENTAPADAPVCARRLRAYTARPALKELEHAAVWG
ncbi:hypothetical protein B0H15DRAFT_955788 [Mycena belliarum]|uniref:Uncharacterized protein n=1 Tax=Mycena belliarum TaxID=1033014 RepID=A0AAD6TSM7_9AGAR|nr:hypothetical protein B0H15DRAFT_955788 [Mycena belliae]